jgi:hypothetical protein
VSWRFCAFSVAIRLSVRWAFPAGGIGLNPRLSMKRSASLYHKKYGERTHKPKIQC